MCVRVSGVLTAVWRSFRPTMNGNRLSNCSDHMPVASGATSPSTLIVMSPPPMAKRNRPVDQTLISDHHLLVLVESTCLFPRDHAGARHDELANTFRCHSEALDGPILSACHASIRLQIPLLAARCLTSRRYSGI